MKGQYFYFGLCFRRFLLVFLVIDFTLLAACSGGRVEKLPPLRVGWSDWAGDYLFVLAEQLGYYGKNGVEVELLYRDSYQASVVEFAAGLMDTTNFQVGDVLFLNSKVDLKVVAVLDSSEGGDFIISTSDIKTPTDLKGKRVGVTLGNVFSELLIQEMLRQYDLSLQDIELVDTLPEQVTSNLGITIDAGHTWAPYDEEAINLGFNIIFSSANTQSLFQDVVAFRSALISERPDDVQAFVTAVLEAADYWNNNPDQAAALIAEYITRNVRPILIGDISSEGVRLFGVSDNLQLFAATDQGSVRNSFAITAAYMINSNRLSRLVDLPTLLDASLLPGSILGTE